MIYRVTRKCQGYVLWSCDVLHTTLSAQAHKNSTFLGQIFYANRVRLCVRFNLHMFSSFLLPFSSSSSAFSSLLLVKILGTRGRLPVALTTGVMLALPQHICTRQVMNRRPFCREEALCKRV